MGVRTLCCTRDQTWDGCVQGGCSIDPVLIDVAPDLGWTWLELLVLMLRFCVSLSQSPVLLLSSLG